jgi:hypothetical protein
VGLSKVKEEALMSTNDPMRELRETTDALDEATLSYLGHLADRDSELAEWVRAVTAHSRAVEAAVQRLETSMEITRMNAGLDPL